MICHGARRWRPAVTQRGGVIVERQKPLVLEACTATDTCKCGKDTLRELILSELISVRGPGRGIMNIILLSTFVILGLCGLGGK